MANIGEWLGFASLLFVILSMASFSGLLSEKAGVINIGINGAMIIGGLVFSILGKITPDKWASNPWYYQIIILIITCLITGLFMLLHGLATITFKADHIVSGMAINILASGIGLFFTSIPSFATGNMIHNKFSIIAIDKNGIFSLYLLIALIIGALLIVFYRFTRHGMNFKAVGENASAAYALGVNVKKVRYIAVFASGCLAGFAGATYTLYNSSEFFGNVSGMGYTALAIVVCSQWRTDFVIGIALMFALLTGSTNVIWQNEVFRNSQDLFRTLPYIVTIILMVIISKRSQMPKSLGQVFEINKS